MLVLSYLTGHNDGFGAQYQRILGIYSICRELNIPYYHTPLSDIEYQGLTALMNNKNSNHFTNSINERIYIESDVTNVDGFFEMKVDTMNISQLLHLKENITNNNKNVVLYLKLPYQITDKFSNMYLNVKNLYKTLIPKNNLFTIGIHVRRGELFVVDSDRMLPNDHYINITQRIIDSLNSLEIPFQIELYTEVPDKVYDITGKHVGINNRIHNSVVIDPVNNNINEFDILPNVTKYINEDILLTFDRMINCDILVSSKSSLSACASYLKNGVTIYEPFWHNMIPTDIPYRQNFEEKINNFLLLNQNKHIPLHCIQVWLQGKLPDKVRNNIMKLNPDIKYSFFDDKACQEFLKENFEENIIRAFTEIKNYAHKCDLFRYCYLYKHGGIYIDADIELRISFEQIIFMSQFSDFITAVGAHSNSRFGECTNGIILCRKNNPIFLNLINNIVKVPNPIDYGKNVKDFYNILNPKIFEQYSNEQITYYLFREICDNNKYYIVNKQGNKIIKTNGHQYI